MAAAWRIIWVASGMITKDERQNFLPLVFYSGNGLSPGRGISFLGGRIRLPFGSLLFRSAKPTGSEENRFRFLGDIVKEIKKILPESAPLLIKLNSNDYTPEKGITPGGLP